MQLKCGHFTISDGCKTCTDLQKKWYRKIAEVFDDAEDFSHPDRPLKCWHRNILSKVTKIEVEITHDYYEKALELLHSFQFKDELQRKIWELHCEGLSRLKIERAIAMFPNTYKQSQIRNIIKDLEREFSNDIDETQQHAMEICPLEGNAILRFFEIKCIDVLDFPNMDSLEMEE